MEIASLADTTLVLLAPGMGDAIQAVKAGMLEIADVFVINKADRPGADATYRDIQGMLGARRARRRRLAAAGGAGHRGARRGHRRRGGGDRQTPGWLEDTGNLAVRRERRAAVEVEAIALGTLRARIGDLHAGHGADHPRGGRRGR